MQRLQEQHISVLLFSAQTECVLPLLTLLSGGSQVLAVKQYKQYAGKPLSIDLSNYNPLDLVPGRSQEAARSVQRACAQVTAKVRKILALPEYVCALSNLTHRELTLPWKERSTQSLELWCTLQECMLNAKSILFDLLKKGIIHTEESNGTRRNYVFVETLLCLARGNRWLHVFALLRAILHGNASPCVDSATLNFMRQAYIRDANEELHRPAHWSYYLTESYADLKLFLRNPMIDDCEGEKRFCTDKYDTLKGESQTSYEKFACTQKQCTHAFRVVRSSLLTELYYASKIAGLCCKRAFLHWRNIELEKKSTKEDASEAARNHESGSKDVQESADDWIDEFNEEHETQQTEFTRNIKRLRESNEEVVTEATRDHASGSKIVQESEDDWITELDAYTVDVEHETKQTEFTRNIKRLREFNEEVASEAARNHESGSKIAQESTRDTQRLREFNEEPEHEVHDRRWAKMFAYAKKYFSEEIVAKRVNLNDTLDRLTRRGDDSFAFALMQVATERPMHENYDSTPLHNKGSCTRMIVYDCRGRPIQGNIEAYFK